MNLNQLVKNLHEGSTTSGLKEDRNILWLNEVAFGDAQLVGEKAAALGEVISNLSKHSISVPDGFSITSHAFSYFLDQTGLREKIKTILIDVDKNTKLSTLEKKSKLLRASIVDVEFPELLKLQIQRAYKMLEDNYEEHVDVALRSSTSSKSLEHSFRGLHDSYLNIHSESQVIHYVKRCFASLFTMRALLYRLENNINHFDVNFSVLVQKMVDTSKSVSGSLCTIDPNTGFDKVTVINASLGLGDLISNNTIEPDEYMLFKPTLEEGYKSLISKKLGSKHIKSIYDTHSTEITKQLSTSKKEQESFSLDDIEALELARLSIIIEDHISSVFGSYQPVDINWAKDESKNTYEIVSVFPERIHSTNNETTFQIHSLEEESHVLLKGHPIGDTIAHGEVRIIHSESDFSKFREGEVLVTDLTDEQFEPLMKKASAVITNRGNRNSHTATFARELEIPVIVDVENATDLLKNGQKITISCEHDIGYIFEGYLKYKVTEIAKDISLTTKTKSYLELTSSTDALESSKFFSHGIGHVSQDSIIEQCIKIHPNSLLYFDELKRNPHAKSDVVEIERLTKGYEDKADFYIDTLACELGKVAASAYPKKVYLGLSNLDSSRYYNLIGGKFFEPIEKNLSLGYRGVSRYLSKEFLNAFKLECIAIRKAREELGFKNIKITLPLCRTQQDLKEVLSILEGVGLSRGHDGLEIVMSCSTPANIVLLDKLLHSVDGVSVDLNHLSNLILGVDSSLEIDSFNYDANDEAVKELLLPVIHRCNERNKSFTIYGDISEDMLSFLIEHNVQSISVPSKAISKTSLDIEKLEHIFSKKTSVFKPGFTISVFEKEDSSIQKKTVKKTTKKSSTTKTSIAKKAPVKKTVTKKASTKKVAEKKTTKKTGTSKKKTTTKKK